jgi:hypothetical protein
MAGLLYYDATTPDFILVEERHHFDRDREWHNSQHFALGTYLKLSSQCILADYTLATGSDAAVTWSLSSGVVVDEDINVIIAGLADGGPYQRWYKLGASGAWRRSAAAVPFFYTAAGYINYNQLTGGSWQLTELANTDYVNYYIFLMPATESAKQILVMPGQAKYATLASAQAAAVGSSDLSGFPSQEYLALYKIIFQAKAGHANTGKCEIAAIERLPANKASSGSSVSPTVHNSLSGRSDPAAHPAASITFTPYSGIGSTESQAAIQEVYDESERSGAVATHAALQTGIHGITIAAGKTFTVNQSLTFVGTDGRTYTHPSTDATIARIDATQTFSGIQIFSQAGGQIRIAIDGTAGNDWGIFNSGNNLYISNWSPSATNSFILSNTLEATAYNAASFLVVGGMGVAKKIICNSDISCAGYFIGKYKSSDGSAGITATKTFYAASSSGGTVNVLNTVTIKDGIITAWTQA